MLGDIELTPGGHIDESEFSPEEDEDVEWRAMFQLQRLYSHLKCWVCIALEMDLQPDAQVCEQHAQVCKVENYAPRLCQRCYSSNPSSTAPLEENVVATPLEENAASTVTTTPSCSKHCNCRWKLH